MKRHRKKYLWLSAALLLIALWCWSPRLIDKLRMCPIRAAMVEGYAGEKEKTVVIGGRSWRIAQKDLPPISRPPSMIAVYDPAGEYPNAPVLFFTPNKSYFYGMYDIDGDGELDFYFIQHSRYSRPLVFLHPFSDADGAERPLADFAAGRFIIAVVNVYSGVGLVLLILFMLSGFGLVPLVLLIVWLTRKPEEAEGAEESKTPPKREPGVDWGAIHGNFGSDAPQENPEEKS